MAPGYMEADFQAARPGKGPQGRVGLGAAQSLSGKSWKALILSHSSPSETNASHSHVISLKSFNSFPKSNRTSKNNLGP